MPHSKYDHLIGSTIGFLTILRHAPVERGSRVHRKRLKWVCLCVCGKVVTLLVDDVTRGYTRSCGCWKKLARMTHGKSSRVGRAPEYDNWLNMRMRCNSPTATGYKHYGGRGITVCERWNNFQYFLDDMGQRPTPNHSIDRIDNSKGYSPDNCKWATQQEQCRNTRRTRMLTFNGQTMCITEWASHTGLHVNTIRYRLFHSGWTIERALTTPPKLTRLSVAA